MKRSALVLLLVSGFAAPAAGQILSTHYTLAGCGAFSCYHMDLNVFEAPATRPYIIFTVSSSYRGLPAGIGGMPLGYLFSDHEDVYDPEGFWGVWDAQPRFQAGRWVHTDKAPTPIYYAPVYTGWRPTGVTATTIFGRVGALWERQGDTSAELFSENVELTVTPEPVTLLLLATGLGGIVAQVRRRRRSTSESKPST